MELGPSLAGRSPLLTPIAGADIADEIRTLDGSGNNRNHRTGASRTRSTCGWRPRTTPTGSQAGGRPSTRYVSNRIFNDVSQNLFSENDVTQWGFAWGQFLDHTFGLREEAGGETARSRSARPTRSRGSRTTSARSRSSARPPRRARAWATAAAADQHRLELHRRVRVYGGHDAARVAARRAGRRAALQQRREAAAATATCRAASPRRRGARRPRWR